MYIPNLHFFYFRLDFEHVVFQQPLREVTNRVDGWCGGSGDSLTVTTETAFEKKKTTAPVGLIEIDYKAELFFS